MNDWLKSLGFKYTAKRADPLREAQLEMPAFNTVKDLYGDRWEEVNGVIQSWKADFK